MLECKFSSTGKNTHTYVELIDTCWNVNSVCISQAALESGELIDTCWNVNVYIGRKGISDIDELIDTCWNVNHHHFRKGKIGV